MFSGKVASHSQDLKSSLRHLDSSLQQSYSQSYHDRVNKRRKTEDNTEDGDDDELSDDDDIMLVTRLRSRLYFEKSRVYKQLDDRESQRASLKYSLRLSYSDAVNNIYHEEFGVKHDASTATEQNYFSEKYLEENLCLRFMTSFDTIETIQNNQQ